MLEIKLVKYEAQDIITASACTHPNMKFVDMPGDWPDNYTCPDCNYVEWLFNKKP